VPGAIAPFLLSGILGYIFVYVLSSGYVHTGYLVRLCPLPIFHIEVMLAMALFALLALAATIIRFPVRSSPKILQRGFAVVSAVLAVAMTAYWSAIQVRHASLIPPDQLSFIAFVKSDRDNNAGLISDNYAVPFGLVARTWTYSSYDLAQEYPAAKGRPRAVSYVWLADRRTNDAYSRPSTFVCFKSISTVNSTTGRDIGQCTYFPLVQAAFGGAVQTVADPAKTPKLIPIARDEAHDRWAIVRLEWPSSQPSPPQAKRQPD